MSNRVVFSILLALGTLACSGNNGQRPTAPTTGGFSALLSLSPDPAAVGGFLSSTSVTLALHDEARLGGTLEEATFVVRDSVGTVVAQSRVAEAFAIPIGGVLRLQRELVLHEGASPGRSLEWRALIRDGRGELHVFGHTLVV